MSVISLRHITSIKEENTVFKQIRLWTEWILYHWSISHNLFSNLAQLDILSAFSYFLHILSPFFSTIVLFSWYLAIKYLISRHLTVFLNLRKQLYLSTLYPNVKYADRSPSFADKHKIWGGGVKPPSRPPPSLRPWEWLEITWLVFSLIISVLPNSHARLYINVLKYGKCFLFLDYSILLNAFIRINNA
jgi:hypothetical protein